MLRIIGKLLVLILSLFAIFLGICAVLGIQVYFPFNIAEGEEIPYHRMQSIRVAVFITFTFYGALYLINSIKEVYPIHFLKVFMISFGITSLIFSLDMLTANVFLLIPALHTSILILLNC